jgi:hypothetical protein
MVLSAACSGDDDRSAKQQRVSSAVRAGTKHGLFRILKGWKRLLKADWLVIVA